jgi:hypothetical protein
VIGEVSAARAADHIEKPVRRRVAKFIVFSVVKVAEGGTNFGVSVEVHEESTCLSGKCEDGVKPLGGLRVKLRVTEKHNPAVFVRLTTGQLGVVIPEPPAIGLHQDSRGYVSRRQLKTGHKHGAP